MSVPAPASATAAQSGRDPHPGRLLRLLGPAFVAAVAYVDPGNVAANLTAGAEHGYLLLWVLVVANAMAVLVQYLSAKLAAVTGKSLAEQVGERGRPWMRRAYWLQAELVAVATDIAEVIGGALALRILFGIPLLAGGVIVGIASLLLLALTSRRGRRPLEAVVLALLAVITLGFLSGLVLDPPDPAALAEGLVPRFDGPGTVLLAASMLGATVMPHAIYLHSALVRDGHGSPGTPEGTRRLLRATRWDVVGSLVLAGTVNVAMLVLAAEALPGVPGTDTIDGAQRAIQAACGPVVGVLFGVGLLASGFASTAVGAHAGSTIMADLLHVRIPLGIRRLVTLIPALIVLGVGMDPTRALVLSQVLLSLGIPAALIPLVMLTGRRSVMGAFVDARLTRIAAWAVTAAIVLLNLVLVGLTLSGAA